MKIPPTNLYGTLPVREGARTPQGRSASSVGGSDRASVSSLAQKLAETVEEPDAGAEAKSAARVAEVKEAVRRGAFPIDIMKLARSIVEKDLLGGR
ncbi:MAG: flagellar biosynthesis anti-sigma factor FlgM [Deltaproteobacteria bacterium]|nr:flagellar biosynthesis anti-sigma factor FlgM [Deltaproteobacteria bacterium]